MLPRQVKWSVYSFSSSRTGNGTPVSISILFCPDDRLHWKRLSGGGSICAYQEVHCDKAVVQSFASITMTWSQLFKSWWTLSHQRSLLLWSQPNTNFFRCLASDIEAICPNQLNLHCVSKSPITFQNNWLTWSSKVFLPLTVLLIPEIQQTQSW